MHSITLIHNLTYINTHTHTHTNTNTNTNIRKHIHTSSIHTTGLYQICDLSRISR
jgi:hypothetical protein